MSTGDVGHFDAGGRLFVDGRDDEMIVSGGENVFPREVEDLLADHDGDRGGRGRRRARRASSASGCGRSSCCATGAELTEEEVQDVRQAEPRPLQGAARGRVRRGAAAQRDRQGAQARADARPRAQRRSAQRRCHASLAWSAMAAPQTARLRSRARLRLSRRRGPAAGARGADRAARARRRDATRAEPPTRCRVRARRLAHDRRRLRAAPALRGGAGGPVHALPERRAAPAVEVDAREVDRPGGGEELDSPYVERRDARPRGVGARRVRAGAAREGALPRGLRRALPGLRGRPQRGRSRAPPRARARPALGEAARAEAASSVGRRPLVDAC